MKLLLARWKGLPMMCCGKCSRTGGYDWAVTEFARHGTCLPPALLAASH